MNDRPEPGFPFRSGITSQSYAESPWIVGQYSGYSGPADTNERFRKMIAAGQQGLAIALDLPTQHGLDPDHELARGEVGRVGVSLSCVDDFDALFDGIPLGSIRQVSTTANAIAPMFAAMILVLAERRGEDPSGFSLRLQNDVLKEYVARGTQIFPVPVGARLSVDVVEYCSERFPDWVPMCVSGYHMRDAGATREQEIGFTLANARQYIDLALERGLDGRRFARSLSWFMSASAEFLHEAAKFRASREVWARTLTDGYGVAEDDARKLRIFAYTLGGELSPFEILNNAPRVTLSALGAVLGGVQALFCSSIDEAIGLPTDDSARLSVRTQQVIRDEAGLGPMNDPLGGAQVVEALTDELVAAGMDIAASVERFGGAIEAIQSGWIRGEIDKAAIEQERALRDNPRVGEPRIDDEQRLSMAPSDGLFVLSPEAERERVDSFLGWRERRDPAAVGEATEQLHKELASEKNVMPAMLEAFRRDLTIGEVTEVLIAKHGAWSATRSSDRRRGG